MAGLGPDSGTLSVKEPPRSVSRDTNVVLSALHDVFDMLSVQRQRIYELALCKRFEGRPLSEQLPCFTVATIMGSLYVSFVHVCIPAVGLSAVGAASLGFKVSFWLSTVAYFQGVATDPGKIPEDWKGDPGSKPQFALCADGKFEPHERKRSGGYRYCHKEHMFKPDRAHYCSALSRNVLRMDHFCPWLTTCVGFKNHKYFILFLLYTVISTNIASWEMGAALLHSHFPAIQTLMMAQGWWLSSLISITLTPFFGFHCWLLSKNMTTLEYCEKRHSEGGIVSPYDLGLLRNIQSIMGEQPILWLLPVGEPQANGVDWEVRRDAKGASEASGSDARRLGLRICSSTRDAVRELWGDARCGAKELWGDARCGLRDLFGGITSAARRTREEPPATPSAPQTPA